MRFRKIKYIFDQANSAKFSHDGRGGRVAILNMYVFKNIAFLKREKFVRNCQNPSNSDSKTSPRLTGTVKRGDLDGLIIF